MTGNRIFVIAGEASGDLHGAEFIKEIKRCNPTVEIWAVGGENMKKAGAKIVVPSSRLSVVGFVEVLFHLGPIVGSFLKIRSWLKKQDVDLLVLIDFPEFNLLMAKYAKALGIKVFYYISPQIWAWRQGRVKKIKKYVDKVAVILPFEKEFYKKFGLEVDYVGHPLIDEISELENREEFLNKVGLKKGERLITLLPGSRSSEIKRLLPIMLESAEKLNNHFEKLQFFLPIAPGLTPETRQLIKELIKAKKDGGLKITALKGYAHESLSLSTLAILASGTVALEAAILNCPMVVIYKVSSLTAFLGRMLIKVPWVSLVNLIAEKEVVPELLQKDANAEEVFKVAKRFLSNERLREQTKKELKKVHKLLGQGGAAKRAASIALGLLNTEPV